MTTTGFVYEMKCPNCGKDFSVNADEYRSITEQLTAQIEAHIREEAKAEQDAAIKAAVSNAVFTEKLHYSALEAKIAQEKAASDKTILDLQNRLKLAEQDTQIAIKKAKEDVSDSLHNKDTEILLLKNRLKSQEQEAQNQAITMKNNYEAALRLKDDEIERIRDFKAKLSTKALGESLEQYCRDQFNSIRSVAFPNAYFEKDNDNSTGSKGDYIFRELVDGIEILSIMFEMKTEADQTATKHKNEDFFAKLDKDRNEKKCEYAVLVSSLEPESEFYNAGIQDVSYRYTKMFVVRPQQFIAIISLLRNAAMNSMEYQKELAMIKSQQLDLYNFESNMNNFKKAFGKNYRLASDKLKAAIDGIDKNIESLQKIRENLLSSENNLRLANEKADRLTIKHLTKGAPSVAAMIADAKESITIDPDDSNNNNQTEFDNSQHHYA